MNKWSSMEFRRTKNVVADHEFAFAIKDETSGEILFLGRVGNPEYEKDENRVQGDAKR